MIRTIIILLLTIVVLPIVALKLDPQPLGDMQWHMLQISGLMALVVALLCFTIAQITGNCSQVDKLWSVMPMVYAWYFVVASDWDPRVLLMAGCVTIWGVRLTYNFARRDAYQWRFWEGEEDYRWGVLRQNPLFKDKPLRWTLFNLFFISLYQHALILFFTLPIVMAYGAAGRPISIWEWLLALIYMGLVVIEATADQQQWVYQSEKHRRLKAGIKPEGEYTIGFVRTGLWAKVRHPNYACEQTIWVIFYLFTVVATGSIINWSMAGSLLLLILFQGSADFSEAISADKYTEYKNYIAAVPRFIPKLW
jgi:steroid 5-alpha reductase family enzyme